MPSGCAARSRRHLQQLRQDTLQDYYEEAVSIAAGPDLRTKEQETDADDLQFLQDLEAAIAASIDGMDVSDLVEQVSAWELSAEAGSNVQQDQSLGAVASDGSQNYVASTRSLDSGTVVVSANDDDKDSMLDTLSFASFTSPDDESHKEAGRDDDDPSVADSCWEEIPETGSVYSMNSFQTMINGSHRPISYRNALLMSKTPKPPVVRQAACSWVQEQPPKTDMCAFPFQLRPIMPKIDEDVDNDDFGQDQWDVAKNMRGGKAGFRGNSRTPWAPTRPGLRAYLNHTRPNVARNKRKVALGW